MRRIYMDHNATTPLHPAVIEEMEPFLRTRFGNPSSLHWAGRQVRPAIDQARERVARLVHCDPAEVVFTSCATESNNTAIKGVTAALRERGNHLITTTVEHPAVLTPCMYLEFFGFRVSCLEVDETGRLDPETLEAAIDEKTILISAMYANNETGVIFPVERIGEVATRRGIVFHCDAAQAVGKIPVDFRAAKIDLMSLSGHKLYAPKGVGALIVRRGVTLHPLLHGGSQEGNRRAGTENVAGIVGLGKACEVAGESLAGEAARLSALRDRLEEGTLETIADVRRNGSPDRRLPNTANLSVLGVDSCSSPGRARPGGCRRLLQLRLQVRNGEDLPRPAGHGGRRGNCRGHDPLLPRAGKHPGGRRLPAGSAPPYRGAPAAQWSETLAFRRGTTSKKSFLNPEIRL